MRHKLSHLKGVVVEVGSPISHRIDAMLSGTRANIAIKIFGSDLNALYRIANEVKHKIEQVEGIVDLSVEQQVERVASFGCHRHFGKQLCSHSRSRIANDRHVERMHTYGKM